MLTEQGEAMRWEKTQAEKSGIQCQNTFMTDSEDDRKGGRSLGAPWRMMSDTRKVLSPRLKGQEGPNSLRQFFHSSV